MASCVIYARFSCSKQREASIDDQLRVCRDYAEREGWDVVAIYTDYAFSGRTDDRPEFQRMILNAGESDYVLVYMMDRFSRDLYDAPIYKKQLMKKGVRVISATEHVDQSPDGIIMEKLLEGLAARESIVTSQRVKRGMEGNALQCKSNGYRVYGYRINDQRLYEVDESEASIVREVFARRINRESINSIAMWLRKMGVTTRHGNAPSSSFVQNMLKNERYLGIYIWGGIRVDGGMPAIIDRATFDAANGIRGKKIRANETWYEFPLVGRLLCKCGAKMVGTSGHGRNGQAYHYYRCTESCGLRNVRAEWLEEEVCDAVRFALGSNGAAMRAAKAIADAYMDANSAAALEAAKKRRDDARRRTANICKAIEDGITPPNARERLSELASIESLAVAEVARLESATAVDVDDLAAFLMAGASMDDGLLLSAFVDAVQVSEDAVSVSVRLDEKSEPIGLAKGRVFDLESYGAPSVPLVETVRDGARVRLLVVARLAA